MSASPVISVGLPCYNCEKTLCHALDSLLAQTWTDFEIVAVDDGSVDATAGILVEYARRDPRIRVITIPHGGVVVAANVALEASQGRYIARMDADDLALPERLAAQAHFLQKNDSIGLVGCRVRFGGTEAAIGYAHYVAWTNTLLDHEAISLNRFVEFPVPNPSIMMRRETLERYGAYLDGDFPEDYELLLRWLESGVRVGKVDSELLVWNDPPQRLSRTHSRYDVAAFYRIKTEYLARWLEKHNPHHPHVHIFGSGRVTRKRAALLQQHGIRFEAYYDVDPRKVGNVFDGVKVKGLESVPSPDAAFCLSYVGNRGARSAIEHLLQERGFCIGKQYLSVA